MIVARGTKEERRRERQGIQLGRRSDSLEKRYDKSLRLFFVWLHTSSLSIPQSPYAVDEAVIRYISFLWEDGETRNLAGDTISALQARVPALKGSLKGSWLQLRAWQNKELPIQAPPLPAPLAWALVCLALEVGLPGVACVFALAWHCMLRTSEAFNLQARHLTLGRAGGAVRLAHTKKGMRDVVAINDPAVAELLRRRLDTLLPGDRLA